MFLCPSEVNLHHQAHTLDQSEQTARVQPDSWPPWVLGLCKAPSEVMEGDTRGLPSRISSIHGSDRKWKHMQVKWIYRLSYVNIYIICCWGGHFKITNNDLPWYGEIFKKWYASVLWGSSAFLQWCQQSNWAKLKSQTTFNKILWQGVTTRSKLQANHQKPVWCSCLCAMKQRRGGLVCSTEGGHLPTVTLGPFPALWKLE